MWVAIWYGCHLRLFVGVTEAKDVQQQCCCSKQMRVRLHAPLALRRYRNGDLITHGNGTASLLFGAVVALLSYATLAPYFLKGETNTSRSFGPFTPSRERDVGAPAESLAVQWLCWCSVHAPPR